MPTSNVRSRNGCYRCRARKIKCDETQPECGRCKSAGFPCPGYKSPTEIVFRSMNKRIEHKVAIRQAKKKETAKAVAAATAAVTEPHSGPSEASSPHDSTSARSPRSPHFRPWEDEADDEIPRQETRRQSQTALVRRTSNVAPTLYVSMSTDWRDPALIRFFNDYVVDTEEIKVSPGYLNFLPELVGEGNDEIITHSVSAVSLASFSNQVRSEELLIKGRKLYGKALLLVKRALSNPKQVTQDGTLAGVFFLNMYEMISGDKPMLNQWGTHADALSMLLRLRGNAEQYNSGRSGGIARGAHGVVMFKNLLRRIPPGPESEDWARSIPVDEPWAQTGLATLRISKLIPMADEILHGTVDDANGYRLLQMINMFEAEDQAFVDWVNSCTEPPYSYGKLDRNVLLSQGNMAGLPLPEVVHYYHDVWITGFWNVYRFARVILLQTLMHLTMRVNLYPELAPMTPRMDRIREHVLREVDLMVSDICASIPYTLGKVDANGWVWKVSPRSISNKAISGYTSVWPLRLALMVRTLSDAQKKYIFEQLAYIEGSMGIKQAKPNV